MIRRRSLKWIGILFVIVGAFYFLLTGSPFPIARIERLKDPVKISEIKTDGLITADGRKLSIKHIQKIPTDLLALQDAVRDGIEVDSDGYLIGRLKIHHWCGNDLVRYHVARINLSWLLILSGESTDLAIPEDVIWKHDRVGLRYGKYGLRIEDYLNLQMINDSVKLREDEPRATPNGSPPGSLKSAQ